MILTKDTFSLKIIPDDESYRYRSIMGDNSISLRFVLPEIIEIPLGASTTFEGQIYTLEKPIVFTKNNSNYFDYKLTLDSQQSKLSKYKFRNTADGTLKFPLTAKPIEHLQMLIDNLNARESGWLLGDCVDSVEKYIGYNHTNCKDALSLMADNFKTEFEVENKTIHLRKVEHNKTNPLFLSYGKGNGFKPGVGRTNFENQIPIEILYVQGGTRNINFSKYGVKELILPKLQTIKYDGNKFEGEIGFTSQGARKYTTDINGLYIKRADKALSNYNEDSLDASDIYPSRIGTVSSVILIDASTNVYEFVDSSIPTDLNFNNCLISNETMTITFQSGMLAGREFQITSYNHTLRKFRLTPTTIDGIDMPRGSYIPVIGDTYAVFNIQLPDAYISDNQSKSGASWDMFKTGVKYLFDNEEQKFSFTGELDGIWAKNDWLNIGGKIKLGSFVSFSDPQFQQENVLVRMIGIKDFINNPHSPILELSNATISGGVSSTLKKLESADVTITEKQTETVKYAKRSFKSAVETVDMIGAALLAFTEVITPAAIKTMDILVGDESLQYRFVNNMTAPETVAHNVVYDKNTTILTIPTGIIQHMTLGIKSIGSKLPVSQYKFWQMSAFTSSALSDTTKRYFVYIKANKTSTVAEFIMSETAIAIEGVSGYYHFLLGTLNSETDGSREFSTMYGFTEILPGRITTDKMISTDGNNYMDFVNNSFKVGNNNVEMSFNKNADGKLILKGSILQTPSGETVHLGIYKGDYDNLATNNKGDQRSFTSSGITSTYQYINDSPTSGIAPTNTTYWKLIASGGGTSTGTQGESGPITVFRGAYSSGTSYYGTSTRRDVVKQNNIYYIAKIGAGSGFFGTAPTDTSKWENFGGQFESVATSLLLAEGANIADWIIANGKIQSQAQTADNTPRAKLNGIDGKIEFASDVSRYTEANSNETIKQTIKIDSTNGMLESRTSDNEISSMTSQGIFANKAGIEALPASTGQKLKGAVVGLGFGKMDKAQFGSDYGMAGVVGLANNSSTNPSPAWGGWFKDLFAMGITFSSKIVNGNITLSQSDTLITCISASNFDIIMPIVQSEGNFKIIKNINSGTVTIFPGSEQRFFDNSTIDLSYTLLNGQIMIMYSVMLNISGTNRMCWIATKI